MTSILRRSQPEPEPRHRDPEATVALDLGAQLETERAVAALERRYAELDRDYADLLGALLGDAPEGWLQGVPETAALQYVRHLEAQVDRRGGDRRPPWEQPAERGTYGVLPTLMTERPDLAYVLNPQAPVPAPTGTGQVVPGTGSKPASLEQAGTPGPGTAEKPSGPVPIPPGGAGPDSGTEGEPENEHDCAGGES